MELSPAIASLRTCCLWRIVLTFNSLCLPVLTGCTVLLCRTVCCLYCVAHRNDPILVGSEASVSKHDWSLPHDSPVWHEDLPHISAPVAVSRAADHSPLLETRHSIIGRGPQSSYRTTITASESHFVALSTLRIEYTCESFCDIQRTTMYQTVSCASRRFET